MKRQAQSLGLAAMLLAAIPAQAGIVVSVVPVTAFSGSTGDTFDVNIQNTGATAQNITAFQLGLSVATLDIIFTGGDESTADTYIFMGDSLDVITSVPYTSVPPPDGQILEGSDISFSGAGTDIPSGATLGLGHIIFNVASGTPAGPIPVTIVPNCPTPNSCTQLLDQAGALVAFTTANGSITVAAVQGVPEPSTWLLSLWVLPLIAWRRRAGARPR